MGTLTNSQVMLILLVWGPHFKNMRCLNTSWPGGCQPLRARDQLYLLPFLLSDCSAQAHSRCSQYVLFELNNGIPTRFLFRGPFTMVVSGLWLPWQQPAARRQFGEQKSSLLLGERQRS